MEAPAKGETCNSKWVNQLARNRNGTSVSQFTSTLTRDWWRRARTEDAGRWTVAGTWRRQRMKTSRSVLAPQDVAGTWGSHHQRSTAAAAI